MDPTNRKIWSGLLLWAALALHALAQAHPTYLPDKVGVWQPFRMSCDGSGRGLTPEQSRIYGEKLYKISEAIHHSRVFDPPMGIEAVPTGCVNATMEFLDDYPDARRTGAIPGYVMVGTFSYAYYAGTNRVVRADEGPHFFVDVNSLMRLYSDAAEIARDEGGKIFPAAGVKLVQGLPFYRGSVVITKTTRPIFLPVSAEQVLQAKIRQAQGELAKAQREHQKQSGEYGRWVANREKREHARQVTYQQLLISNLKGASDFLRVTEENEVREEARLKAEADHAGTPSTAEQFKQKELDGYQAELAALSPEQRTAQAWYTWQRQAGEPLLTNPQQREAKPLVRFNPDFFDRSRPRTDIQVLVVGRVFEDFSDLAADPAYQSIMDFRKSFDFRSLLSLLDE
jgi:hypothetical protein